MKKYFYVVRLTFRKQRVRVDYPERPGIPYEPSLEHIEERFGRAPKGATSEPFRGPGLDRTEDEELQLAQVLKTAKSTEIEDKIYVEKPKMVLTWIGGVLSLLIGAVELVDGIWNKPIDTTDKLITAALVFGPIVLGALVDGLINAAATIANKVIKYQEMQRARVECANRILNNGLVNEKAADILRDIAREPIFEMTEKKIDEIRNGVYCAVVLSPIVAAIAAVGGADREGNDAVGVFAATFALVAAAFTLKVTRTIEKDKKPIEVRIAADIAEDKTEFDETEKRKEDKGKQGTK